MSFDDNIAIRVSNLSKCYQIYRQPQDRLKQSIFPRLQKVLGKAPEQYFKEFWALKKVSFEIKKGETIGIIGRNGSGKSTLLQIICGTLNPTEGHVQTNGRIAALLELGSGFNPEFTGRENVYMNASVLGLSNAEIDRRFSEIAAFADIGQFIEQPVKTYSSGMAVRLAFSVAINVDPEILVVDEALSVGDELFQRKCFSKIEALKKNGATILFVSHSGTAIAELCDHAILMDDGEKLLVGAPKQVVGRYQRLLYAPSDKRAIIRDQIRELQVEEYESSGANNSKECIADVDEQTEKNGLQESYDPNLKPQSTIEYESHGAYIEAPQLVNMNGQRVNNLVRGRFYRYTYTVHFENAASNVRFGMLIKTVNGVELGGAISATDLANSIPLVLKGSRMEVTFEFKCSLNVGTYFLNAGVIAIHDGIEIHLHRLLDIEIFRVMPDSRTISVGIVDFECSPKFKSI